MIVMGYLWQNMGVGEEGRVFTILKPALPWVTQSGNFNFALI